MTRVSQADFARLCGVNRSTVSRWIKDGRIDADAQGRIDPVAAQRLRLATESPLPHHQARKAQFDEARAGGDTEDGSETAPAGAEEAAEPSSLEGLGHQLKRATVELQRNKAELAAMEIDKAAGALVAREDIDFVLADFGGTLRGLMEGLPDRLAGEIAAHRGDVNAIHKSLEDAAREILLAISAQMERRIEELAA